MDWNELETVAAMSPGTLGLAVGIPIVRDCDHKAYRPRRVDTESPVLGPCITEDELQAILDTQSWKRIPSNRCRRNYLAVVRSASFAHDIALTRFNVDPIQWNELPAGASWAYCDSSVIGSWQRAVAEHVLTWVRQSTFRSNTWEGLESLLRQLLFVVDVGSDYRKNLFVQLGYLISNFDPARFDVVRDLACREQNRTAEEFERDVKLFAEGLPGSRRAPEIFSLDAALRSFEPILLEPVAT